MSKDLTKKAVEMLLNGGTLLGEKCPYCSGVRVIKDGRALCASCGRGPLKKEIPKAVRPGTILEKTLEGKIECLAKELEDEKDHIKQQEILKSINSLLETLEKTKNKQ